MPVDKTDLFKPKDARLARIAKALSHPARVAILRELAQRSTCVCGQLVDVIPLAQATVSQHLKELKTAGLITGEIDGPRSCYCINSERIDEFRQALEGFFTEMHCSQTNNHCP